MHMSCEALSWIQTLGSVSCYDANMPPAATVSSHGSHQIGEANTFCVSYPEFASCLMQRTEPTAKLEMPDASPASEISRSGGLMSTESGLLTKSCL